MGSSSLLQRWNTLTGFQKLMIGGLVVLILYGAVTMIGTGGRLTNPAWIAAVIAIVFVALPFHEFAHAATAVALGDDTPKWQGRYTLNPLVHIDPVGAVLIYLAGFGWAKPVMWNPANITVNMRLGSILVAVAGPLSNLALAIVTVLVLRYVEIPSAFAEAFARSFVGINVALFVFNMIPVPPLDGSHILFALLPGDTIRLQLQLRQYGFVILIAILWFARPILFVPIDVISSALLSLI